MTEKRCLVEVNYTVNQVLWVNATTPSEAQHKAEDKVAELMESLPVCLRGCTAKLLRVEDPEVEIEKGE